MSGMNHANENYYPDRTWTGQMDTDETEVGWHVVWTRSNFEQIVRDELLAKCYEVFLPTVRLWSTRHRRRATNNGPEIKAKTSVLNAPMFKGYLFVRNRMDKAAYIDISNTRGVVHILGARWDRPARIPDTEIETIKCMMDSQLPLLPYPYIKAGSKVRITRGALANAQGVLVESDSSRGLFVVSVSLLQSSVAVGVNCADVEPI